MNAATLHLQKTLCAMRWIALIAGRTSAADTIEQDLKNLKGEKP